VPELPEVESVRRQLAPLVVGRRVTAVWRDPYPARRLGPLDGLAGRRVVGVDRRGKFLLVRLDPDDRELVCHLGMTGGFSTVARSALSVDLARTVRGLDAAEAAERAHDRVRLALDDDRVLAFRDPRRFGRVQLVPTGDHGSVPTLARLGPEPLSDAFDPDAFASTLAVRRAPVKACLLDQHVVAGVGNIYADEALWRARIHPASRRVGRERAHRLHGAVREVLTAAIEREGTTFRDYRAVNGESGRFATELEAYGRAGRTCRRCGATMRRSVVAGRGTTHCPGCQRA
jgi:formamidopyrimidine-DNA glycosylase